MASLDDEGIRLINQNPKAMRKMSKEPSVMADHLRIVFPFDILSCLPNGCTEEAKCYKGF